MAVIQSATTTDILTVDPTMKSFRTSMKPDELTGDFQVSAITGAMTVIAAAGPVFSFRYAPGFGQLCVVKRISITATVTAGFTAGQQLGYGVFVARNFLASDSGGTALAPFTGSNQKIRTALNSSGVTDCRISTTGVLTAGTRTLDTQPLGLTYAYAATTTAGTIINNVQLISYNFNDYPLVLQNNEGFVIANQVLQGAGGTVGLVVNVEWFETDAYKASVNN
jgi:hypothetical protein